MTWGPNSCPFRKNMVGGITWRRSLAESVDFWGASELIDRDSYARGITYAWIPHDGLKLPGMLRGSAHGQTQSPLGLARHGHHRLAWGSFARPLGWAPKYRQQD